MICNGSTPDLTYSELTDYYNELVLQLRLAEHNLNESIHLEIDESSKHDALQKQREIIKLLNESILPALQFTVSYYMVAIVTAALAIYRYNVHACA